MQHAVLVGGVVGVAARSACDAGRSGTGGCKGNSDQTWLRLVVIVGCFDRPEQQESTTP